jgi:hypothetical protein
MRVFLDADILFSAVRSDRAVRELQRFLLDSGHECWTDHSPRSLAEQLFG